MSQISEDVKMKGELRIVKRNSLGEILQEVTVPNLVVTTGKTFIANRMTSVTSNQTSGIMTYMGIGGIIQWPVGQLISSKPYAIGFLGTTDFTIIGAAASPTVGTVFTCSGGAQSGTGWASPVLTAGNFVPGQAYTICGTLNNSSQAQWNTIAGTTALTYALGTTFIAAVTGSGQGTGTAYTSQTAIAVPVITDTTLNNEQLRQPLTTIAATAMVAGTTYTILSTGSTNFVTYGATVSAEGYAFVATGAGVGTGTVIVGGTSSANTVTYGSSFAPIVMGNLIVGQTYQIANHLGSTSANWLAVGASSATAGLTFVATATGSGQGTGTVGIPIALYEAGLFSGKTFGAANSNMLCRTNYSIITKNAGDSIAITWVVTVA